MRKVIIETRINEYASRAINPNIPWTAAEIAADAAACVDAGAAIIHFHARTADGRPAHDYAAYKEVVAALRAAGDMLIHPTLGAETVHAGAAERIDHILRLVADGLSPDLAPLDMVSSNADSVDTLTGRFLTEDVVYVNTTQTLRYFAERLRAASVTPYAQIWNVPSLRQAIAFVRAGILATPLFLSFALTEGGVIAGHPGTATGLRAFVDFLPEDIILRWSAVLFGGNLLPLVPQIVAAGGHISIGLGDYPYPELGRPTNAELIAKVAQIVRENGAEVATPDEARAILGMQPNQRPHRWPSGRKPVAAP